jgi:hypothetical protein
VSGDRSHGRPHEVSPTTVVFEVEPRVGAGPIRFGMTRAQARSDWNFEGSRHDSALPTAYA